MSLHPLLSNAALVGLLGPLTFQGGHLISLLLSRPYEDRLYGCSNIFPARRTCTFTCV